MPSSEFGQLQRDERIVWSGQPWQGLMFMPVDIALVPLSLIFFGYAVFWETRVFGIAAAPEFNLFSIPVILFGLFFVAGRFFADAWLRRTTRYAITNRRVLIQRSGLLSDLLSVNLDRVEQINIAERADGRGTIRFGRPLQFWYERSMGPWMPSLDPTPQFLGIADARIVYDRIQRLMPQQTIPV